MNEPKPNEAETGAAVGCSALLGCPFCGGAAEVFDGGSTDIGDWWLAGCKACGIWLPNEGNNPTRQEAVMAWNTRWQPNAELSDRRLSKPQGHSAAAAEAARRSSRRFAAIWQ